MSSFEFFMGYYGLLLGLALAELMNRVSGMLSERDRPRIGVMTPLMVVLLFTEMLANYIDAWNRLQGIRIDLASLFVPTAIAMIYFVVAVSIVPRDLSDWRSLDDYFDARRRWLVGLLLLVNAVAVFGTMPSAVVAALAAGRFDGDVLIQVTAGVCLLASYVLLLLARPRWLQVAALLTAIAFYPIFYIFVRMEIFRQVAGA